MSRAVGIDLGTTNSVVSVLEGGEPVVAPTLEQLIEQQQAGLPAALRDGADHLVHIYTSGTTGSPKAVPVPVRALAAFGIGSILGTIGGGWLFDRL